MIVYIIRRSDGWCIVTAHSKWLWSRHYATCFATSGEAQLLATRVRLSGYTIVQRMSTSKRRFFSVARDPPCKYDELLKSMK
jgi:hypothetical protein